MNPLSIVHVSTEFAPLVRVGGRADMVGGLAREQARSGHRVLVVLPRYAFIDWPAGSRRRALESVEVPWGMGKHSLTKIYMHFLGHWARKLSWKETAESFHTTWDKVHDPVEYLVDGM